MKSFSRIHLNTPYERLVSWDPPELSVETPDDFQDVQKELLLSLFGTNVEGVSNGAKKGRHSALRPTGTNQSISDWKPTSVTSKSQTVRKAEWSFLEAVEDLPEDQEKETQTDNFAPTVISLQERLNSEREIAALLETARIQAEEIILAAQAEADNVLMQSQNEIDEQKKQGYQQGMHDANLEIEDALKAVRAMVEEVGSWKASLLTQAEQVLVEMLKEISRKMFGDGVELDKATLQTNLNRIMESAHGLGNLNIFLNPRDARMLDSSWVDQQMLITGGQAKIIPSGNITRGGCYVKGNMGTVDGRVETQLDAFLKTFDEASKLAE
jgi:flagellar biosynthesis/type III secretory pathway protein FliH